MANPTQEFQESRIFPTFCRLVLEEVGKSEKPTAEKSFQILLDRFIGQIVFSSHITLFTLRGFLLRMLAFFTHLLPQPVTAPALELKIF